MIHEDQLRIDSPQRETGAHDFLQLTVSLDGAQADMETDRPALQIEFDLLIDLISEELADAVEEAAESIGNLSALAGMLALENGEGWSGWARTSSNPDVATIALRNDRDEWGENLSKNDRGIIRPGNPLMVTIPMAPPEQPTQIHIAYRVRAQNEHGDSGLARDGEIFCYLLPEQADELPKQEPVVVFTSDRESPTALRMGAQVRITWRIEQGVSAKLLGPLPGGNQVLTLDDETEYPIREGALMVRAVGAQTYLLQAVVRPEQSSTNIQVIRTLHLDVVSAEKFSAFRIMPNSVLPNGWFDAHWVVWGVQKARIDAGGLNRILFTSPAPRDGQGVKHFRVDQKPRWDVDLITSLQNEEFSISHSLRIRQWDKVNDQLQGQQPTRGFAVALTQTKGTLARCTLDQLWFADVGAEDPDDIHMVENLKFRPSEQNKNWYGVVAIPEGFAAIGKVGHKNFELLRFDLDGKPSATAITLPPGFAVFTPASHFEMVAIGPRVYVRANERNMTQAASIDLSASTFRWFDEPLLDGLPQFRIVTVHGAVYGLHPASGHLVRLAATEKNDQGGSLHHPRQCASALDEDGRSAAKSGLPVAIDRVLVLLGRADGDRPADLVYNPQADTWSECGNGLVFEASPAAAFRTGDSPRLWACNGDSLHTLSVGSVKLFSRDFLFENPDRPLTKIYFDRQTSLTISNATGTQLTTPNQELFQAGLTPSSLDGPALITTAVNGKSQLRAFPQTGQSLAPGTSETWEIHFNSTDPPLLTRLWCVEGTNLALELRLHPQAVGNKIKTKVQLYEIITSAPNTRTLRPVIGYTAQEETDQVNLLPWHNLCRLWTYNATDFHVNAPIRNPQTLQNQTIAPHQAADISFVVRHHQTQLNFSFSGRNTSGSDVGTINVQVDLSKPDGIGIGPVGSNPKERIHLSPEKQNDAHFQPDMARFMETGKTLQLGATQIVPTEGEDNYFFTIGQMPQLQPDILCRFDRGMPHFKSSLFLGWTTSFSDYCELTILIPGPPLSIPQTQKGTLPKWEIYTHPGQKYSWWRTSVQLSTSKKRTDTPDYVILTGAGSPQSVHLHLTPVRKYAQGTYRGETLIIDSPRAWVDRYTLTSSFEVKVP